MSQGHLLAVTMSDQTTTKAEIAGSPTSGSEALLRETLKRCSSATLEAALEYRASKNTALVPVIVLGIVERFLDPEVVGKLRSGDDSIKFMEDLGMDSLTMIEAIMMVEESLGVSIKNDELMNLRSIGDLKSFIEEKISGVSKGETSEFFSIEQVAAIMPQQEPFLFLEQANLDAREAVGRYTISGRESFLEGHFKGNPVFPASIMLEALGQLAVFSLLKKPPEEIQLEVDPGEVRAGLAQAHQAAAATRARLVLVPGVIDGERSAEALREAAPEVGDDRVRARVTEEADGARVVEPAAHRLVRVVEEGRARADRVARRRVERRGRPAGRVADEVPPREHRHRAGVGAVAARLLAARGQAPAAGRRVAPARHEAAVGRRARVELRACVRRGARVGRPAAVGARPRVDRRPRVSAPARVGPRGPRVADDRAAVGRHLGPARGEQRRERNPSHRADSHTHPLRGSPRTFGC